MTHKPGHHTLPVGLPASKAAVEKALERLSAALHKHAPLADLPHTDVWSPSDSKLLKDMEKRGSHGRLFCNVAVPPWVAHHSPTGLEYIAAHELAHLRVASHGKRHDREVRKVLGKRHDTLRASFHKECLEMRLAGGFIRHWGRFSPRGSGGIPDIRFARRLVSDFPVVYLRWGRKKKDGAIVAVKGPASFHAKAYSKIVRLAHRPLLYAILTLKVRASTAGGRPLSRFRPAAALYNALGTRVRMWPEGRPVEYFFPR